MHTSSIRLVLFSLFLAGLATAGAPQKSSIGSESTKSGPSLAAAAKRAIAHDPAALATLRAAGQPGVDALAAALEAPSPLLDRVCAQFDCATSLLYWHTNLEAAKAQALREDKPILSLRLLGRLDEELSCANSRFFRATLYPNEQVNEILRRDFVLHWETVRPVPKVTIDFGDGRTLERTLIGNSIHYVLDAKGRPVDGIPGLHGAKAFAGLITRAGALARKTTALDGEERRVALMTWHRERRGEIAAAWTKDLGRNAPKWKSTRNPDQPLLDLEAATSETMWKEIADRRRNEDAALDDAARAASTKLLPPSAWDAGQIAVTKAVVENPMLRQFDVLQRSISLDGLKNERLLHPKIHEWFEKGTAPQDLNMLDERVYEQLFLMPLSDPWLGLSPRDSFSAITADGRR